MTNKLKIQSKKASLYKMYKYTFNLTIDNINKNKTTM